MLHPDKDRINFGEALRPIVGYELDYAVGTTYSLDLEAVMFLPVSLFFGEDLKIEKQCSNELLTALTQVPEKVQIFCQRGKISTPYFYHNILAFWENSIEQIHLDAYNQSFHPKIWLLRYKPTDKKMPIRYRFICTSRNLTKCNDWDIALTLEGTVDKTSRAKNKPLQDFMKFLDKNAKRKIKPEMLAEILKINFELSSNQADYNFFPIGIGNPHPLFDSAFAADDLLVVSPFLQVNTIHKLSEKVKQLHVFSTKYELDKLPVSIVDDTAQIFQFNPLLENNFSTVAEENNNVIDVSDTTIESEDEYNSSNSLHAKLYVTKQNNDVTWYVGSANCTSPAETRNIEFLTSIHGTEGNLDSLKDLLKELTEGDKNGQGLFIKYTKTDVIQDSEEEQLDLDLRKVIHDLASLNISATAELNNQKLYDYKLHIALANISMRKGWKIYLQPLSGRKGKKCKIFNSTTPQQLTFENFEEARLTPYFLFTIVLNEQQTKELVVKLDITFSDERMSKIFKSLIGNWEKLMKYLTYLLGQNHVESMFNLQDGEKDSATQIRNGIATGQFPIYEKLLVASSRDTNALRQTIKVVESLVDELDENAQPIIPADFKTLIATFKEVFPNEN